MEVLVSSVTPMQLMTGKILGQALVILSQFGIWALVGTVLYLQGLGGRDAGQVLQAMTPSLLGFLLLYFLLGYFLYAALFSAVGAICTSEMEAQQTQTPLVLMQILVGVSMAYGSLTPAGQVAHLTASSLILGTETVLLLLARWLPFRSVIGDR